MFRFRSLIKDGMFPLTLPQMHLSAAEPFDAARSIFKNIVLFIFSNDYMQEVYPRLLSSFFR